MTEARAQQIFKNRKAAHRWLQAENIPVGQTKFYEDCDRFGLIQPDKSILLADLLAYVKTELKTGPAGPSRDMGAEDRAREKENLEIEKLRQAVRKGELENRKEDEKWLHKDDAWTQIAGLVGLLRDNLRHHFHLGQGRLVHLAGGEPSRGPEVYEGCEEILAKAFNELSSAGRMEVLFEEEE